MGELPGKVGLLAIYSGWLRIWDSRPQIKRPTNWATPGYEIKKTLVAVKYVIRGFCQKRESRFEKESILAFLSLNQSQH